MAIVLKPRGTKWWDQIDNTNVTWTDNVYERLQINPDGNLRWGPILAEVIDERVEEKDMCLFKLADDALFRAVTDAEVNPRERYAHLSTDFDFYVRDPDAPVREFYLKWAVTFNPTRGRYDACNKQTFGVLEVLRERKAEWAEHVVEASGAEEDLDALARRVVEENGCLVLPTEASAELRLAAAHALFFVTFPDRRPDEPGGILRGCQLPGRMVTRAAGKIRGDGKAIVERRKHESAIRVAARRQLVVDTLLARAARVLAARNGMDEDEARRRILSVQGRDILERAATRWGMMDGNALKLFKPKPTAGALKLPDLSLALGFELRLGLDSAQAGVARLVQTAKIRALDDAAGAVRESFPGSYALRAMWSPMPGRETAPVEPRHETLRILHDETGWYLLALPRYGQLRYDRDVLVTGASCLVPRLPSATHEPRTTNHEPPTTNHEARTTNHEPRTSPIPAYHFESASKSRTRQDARLVCETYDWNKVMKIAREGRLYLWRIDFGADEWLAQIAFSPANVAPCRVIPSAWCLVPDAPTTNHEPRSTKHELRATKHEPRTTLSLTFLVNAMMPRDTTKSVGRDWQSYCWAYPEDAKRPIIAWNGRASVEAVVAQDGVMLVDREHADEALRAMTYVVVPGREPMAPGGAYNGYFLRDRIFFGEEKNAECLVPRASSPQRKARTTNHEPRATNHEPPSPASSARGRRNTKSGSSKWSSAIRCRTRKARATSNSRRRSRSHPVPLPRRYRANSIASSTPVRWAMIAR